MSGARDRRIRSASVSIRAIAILVEAQGEIKTAEGHVEVLLPDELVKTFQSLVASIQGWLQKAFRSTSLDELQANLQELDQAVQGLLMLLDQVKVPPLSSYVHQLQLARDWLGVSRGKIQVALTYARLDYCLKSQAASPGLEN